MMASVWLVLAGAGLTALSGLPALLFPRGSSTGQRVTVGLFLAGCAFGLSGAVVALGRPGPAALDLPWALPWGSFSVSVDPLSAFFLVLVFAVPALGSIYGLGYWKQEEHPGSGARLGLFYGLLTGGMALVTVARDIALFLMAWELMALAAYFAATAEDDDPEVRKAGWIYLVATHIGTLVLIAMFALWRKATGSFALEAAAGLPAAAAGTIYALALVGFGFKAGLMPFHVWLPGAHANAPSHVSAVMSGVMLKMGIYGIVRMSGLLGAGEPWWGAATILVGAVTAVAGIAFALGQRDLKRVLAYSSIENLGIVAMGVGLALLGKATGRTELALLGLAGALLHAWNHGLFKSLLFLGSGAVIHGAGGRDIELMGGLGKRMPVTAALFMAGSVAICALPPLNGFAGEWLVYLASFATMSPTDASGLSLAGLAAVALAMAGALALAAFVRLYGAVFLGEPRAVAGAAAHAPRALHAPCAEHTIDPGPAMIVPMAVLAAACVVIGLRPTLVMAPLEAAVRAWSPAVGPLPSLEALAPLGWVSAAGFGLLALATGILLVRRLIAHGKAEASGPTWDCGYARPTARMQYTGTSFAQPLVDLFRFALRPRVKRPEPHGPLPGGTGFETDTPDIVLDGAVLPVFEAANRVLPRVHAFQRGQTHLYVLYVLVITALLFVFGGIGVAP